MDILSKHELLDVIHYYEQYLKDLFEELKIDGEYISVSDFHDKFYSIYKTMSDVTVDNNGPVDCHSFILDETGKVPMPEFCECCEYCLEQCPGELPAATLRKMIEKHGGYLEGDD